MKSNMKKFWNLETEQMNRFTFWIVAAQAILVVALLGVTLINVTEQSALAEAQALTNETLIEVNNIVSDEIHRNQTQMVESLFCLLNTEHKDRNPDKVDECLAIFLDNPSIAPSSLNP